MTHIVQVSLDDDVFNKKAAQDSRSRQIGYAAYIENKLPTAHLTNIVLTTNPLYTTENIGRLSLIPCSYNRLRHITLLAMFLYRLHKLEPIDLLTTQDFHGIFWAGLIFARFTGIPVVGQVHYDLDSRDARQANLRTSFGWAYEKLALKASGYFDGLRVVNTASKQFLEKFTDVRRIQVCPVPVTIYPTIKETTDNFWNSEAVLRVLFVGRLVEVKNIPTWLRVAQCALQRHNDIEFVLIGDGDQREMLEAMRDSFGLQERVRFIGALPPSRLANWYAEADVLLLTSKYEGFGRVIVEAMFWQVVPICTNVAGPRDIIEHGVSGYLGDADPERLADLLETLARDHEKLRQLKDGARIKAERNFSPEHLRKGWLDFLTGFLPTPGSSPK